uniref:Uncharacterized protein n=1 Tax=Avena sativa TaxID=4498 RepID=A0ACD6AAQ7_AVESA
MEDPSREEAAMLLVQELAGDVPERYVIQVEDRPRAGAPVAPIPVIDLGLLSRQHTAEGVEELARLRSALESWGTFLVTNHGVEPSVMDAMWSAARDFFQRPIQEKKKYADLDEIKHYDDYHEGYGTKQVKSPQQTSLEWSDRLLLQVEPQDQRKLHLWPQSLRDILLEFSVQQQCGLLTNGLLPAMATLLGLRKDYFTGLLRGGRNTTFARINYYPMCQRPDLVCGVKPHSDATLISVLMVDENVDGLQILIDDIWYHVPTASSKGHPHALLVLVGDVVEIISNGVFKSPVHRAMTNAQKERMSVVMFYGPDLDKEIGPAEELTDDSRPARYKKVKGVDYLPAQYEHASRGERALDTLRI